MVFRFGSSLAKVECAENTPHHSCDLADLPEISSRRTDFTTAQSRTSQHVRATAPRAVTSQKLWRYRPLRRGHKTRASGHLKRVGGGAALRARRAVPKRLRGIVQRPVTRRMFEPASVFRLGDARAIIET